MLFQRQWKKINYSKVVLYKRCLKTATGFFEKGFRIRKKNYATIWLGGIWSRWCSLDGAELESFCLLIIEANKLIKPIHRRITWVIPNQFVE